MKALGALSDRLLQLVVPKATAGAQCLPCGWDGRACGPGGLGDIWCCPRPDCSRSCYCVYP